MLVVVWCDGMCVYVLVSYRIVVLMGMMVIGKYKCMSGYLNWRWLSCVVVWLCGCLGVWVYGCLGVIWVYRCMGVWVYGCMCMCSVGVCVGACVGVCAYVRMHTYTHTHIHTCP